MCGLCEGDVDGWAKIDDAHIPADVGEVLDGAPKEIVGADDEEEVVQPGKLLPEPYKPSAKERAIHDLTHLPYRGWCEHCVKARRPKTHHRAKSPSSQRTIPLLVAEYCHVRDSKDEELATILVARLYPSKALLAVGCDRKGIDDYVINRLAA